jgi:hypothetical protein
MKLATLALAGLVWAASPRPAVAEDVAVTLQGAADALQTADYQRAAQIAGELARREVELASADRAEAWRIYGLALFFLERRGEAERALLALLRLDPDVQLDPTLVPPEAIRFFDELRLRHADEIARSRPRARQVQPWLNLVPPLGQFQNGERGKGWWLVGAGLGLVGANLGSFALLRRWCGGNPGGVCIDADGGDKTAAARVLKRVNAASAVGLAALYLYGVVDGYRGFRQPVAPGLGVQLDADRALVLLTTRF